MAAAKKEDPQGKCWCFTLFYEGKYEDGADRPSRELALELIDDLIQTHGANYCVWGDEVCPTTKSKHLQCYIQFQDKKRLGQLTKVIPRTHFKVAVGNDTSNFIYCTKDGKYDEFGERRDTTGGRQGKEAEQKRWAETRLAACSGNLSAVDDQIFIQHYAALKSIAKDHMKMPDGSNGVTGVWIWGPPGVGKSRKARADYPEAYFKLCNKWWDGFNPAIHKYVIIDDIDKNHSVLAYHLKIWADRYAFMAETKGGALAIRPDKIVATSNYSIEDIFGPDESAVDAIRRRFSVMHMDEPFRDLTKRQKTQSAVGTDSKPEFNSVTSTSCVSGPILDMPISTQDALVQNLSFTQQPTQILVPTQEMDDCSEDLPRTQSI
jgi:hypothetical protein